MTQNQTEELQRIAIRWYRSAFFAKPQSVKLLRSCAREILDATDYSRETCRECLHLELDHVPTYGCFQCLQEQINGAFHEYIPGGGIEF